MAKIQIGRFQSLPGGAGGAVDAVAFWGPLRALIRYRAERPAAVHLIRLFHFRLLRRLGMRARGDVLHHVQLSRWALDPGRIVREQVEQILSEEWFDGKS